MEGKETYSQRRCLDIMDQRLYLRYLNVLCVPCQELVRLTCVTHPGNSVLTVTYPVVDRSQLRSNGHKRVHTGYLHDAERTRTGQTAHQRTSNVHPPDIFIRWRPFEVLNMSKTCQRIRPDKADIPDTERIHRMRNGQETHANGHERTENFTVR